MFGVGAGCLGFSAEGWHVMARRIGGPTVVARCWTQLVIEEVLGVLQVPGEATQGGNAAGECECEADGSEQAADGGERAAGETHFAADAGESCPAAAATEPGVR